VIVDLGDGMRSLLVAF